MTEEYILSWDAVFYAIEVLVQWAWPLRRGRRTCPLRTHGRPFTPKEVAMASELVYRTCEPGIVCGDLAAHVYDATSKHVHEWAKV